MKIIWTLSLVTTLAFCTLCGFVAWDTRGEAVEQTNKNNANLVQALSEDIARSFETYDLSIRGVISLLNQPGVDRLNPALRRTALFDNAARASYLDRIVILDSNGRIVESSAASERKSINYSGSEYFTVHRENPDQGLYVSKPFEPRSTSGEWIIALSRRIPGPQGSFRGVVVGMLDLTYFESLFINLHAGPQNDFAVIRSDGTMIARYPFELSAIGLDVGKSELFRHFPAMRNGSYGGVSVADGERRVYSYTQIGNLPLIVAVATDESSVFATWLHKALLIGLLMAILAIAMAALALCLMRELRRRRLTEKKLESAAAALAVMAATDGLTGLANRRHFDQSAETEWKRAIHTGKPLSILVVDVDFFKAFNDACGHLRGDDVLKAVASCVQATLTRPSDFAARYGGEEFALILPNTLREGAMQVAEVLRGMVAQKSIYHPHGLGKRLSVSIGITTVLPRKGDFFADAFAAADEALFRAKNLGRDRIEYFDESHLPPCESPIPATSPTELSISEYLQ
jgi:diguanylate cyclase (GGDEF)-like protein